jgi:hypothetical protein
MGSFIELALSGFAWQEAWQGEREAGVARPSYLMAEAAVTRADVLIVLI